MRPSPLPDLQPRKVSLAPYSFWEFRAGRGTPLVLLHGLSGSSRWWRRNIEALAVDHLVCAVDLIGFGRNRPFFRPSPLPLTFHSLTSLLIRWIEASFDEPVHIAGHSMGGQIGIHLAARRPDLVRSLVLVNATGIPFSIDPRAHVESVGRPPTGFVRFIRLLTADFLRAGPTSVAVASARILFDDARESMRSVDRPVLIVWGEKDPLIPLRYAEEMQREIRGSELVVLEGAAHVAMWENASAFNQIAKKFLQRVEASPVEREKRPRGEFVWEIEDRVGRTAFRRSSAHSNTVLVHGLGMSSAYFGPLAHALSADGFDAIAPDLPGFGQSADGPEVSPRAQAIVLAELARRHGISGAIWIGHSTGCQIVNHVAASAPSLVAAAVYIAPIWNRWKHPVLRLMRALLADVFREHLSLLVHAVRDYWRAGLLRWLRNFVRFSADARQGPETSQQRSFFIAGDRDPLMDWKTLEEICGSPVPKVPGGHGVVDSAPVELAEAISGWYRSATETSPDEARSRAN